LSAVSGRISGAALALLWLVLGSAAPVRGDVLEVPDQFPTIQSAISAAQAGDEVVVAPGVYPERIHLLGKAITVRSTDGPDLTIIDASGLNQDVITCTNDEGPDTVIRGFTVTGGVDGVLTRLSAPMLADCAFIANAGCGMSCDHGSPIAIGCGFDENEDCGVYNVGGALVLERCSIDGNAAGGLRNETGASATLLTCSVAGNVGVFGAGLRNTDGCSVRLLNCAFIANHAFHLGGAMLNDSDCDVRLVNGLFSGNTADVDGGAIYNLASDLLVTNATFTANVAGRHGGALLHAGGTATLDNAILWSNEGGEIHKLLGAASVSFSDVLGGWDGPGEGNIDADPMFVDPGAGDFRLASGSPCIDAADNAALPADDFDLDGDGDTDELIPFDLDGHPRLVDDPETQDTGHGEPPLVDMGAYEYQATEPPECPADFDGDGDVDSADLLFLLAAWGTPDGDVDGDGDTDATDLLALLAAWGQCPDAL
jgi:serine protease